MYPKLSSYPHPQYWDYIGVFPYLLLTLYYLKKKALNVLKLTVPETNGVIDLSLADVFSFTMTLSLWNIWFPLLTNPTLKIKHSSEAESAASRKKKITTSHKAQALLMRTKYVPTVLQRLGGPGGRQEF